MEGILVCQLLTAFAFHVQQANISLEALSHEMPEIESKCQVLTNFIPSTTDSKVARWFSL